MRRFIQLLEKVQLAVGVLSLSIFFLAIIYQVLTRYAGISTIWTEEVANYSFIWAVFMGASVMVNRREHFRFDLLSRNLKGKAKVYLDTLINSILLVFSFAIFYYGIIAVQNFWDYRWVSLPMIKMGYVWISVPIMGITMLIYTLGHMVDDIRLQEPQGKE